jgi:hypothetical protein
MFMLANLGKIIKFKNKNSKANNETIIAGSEGFNELRVFD